jgi:hypothetical protein
MRAAAAAHVDPLPGCEALAQITTVTGPHNPTILSARREVEAAIHHVQAGQRPGRWPL